MSSVSSPVELASVIKQLQAKAAKLLSRQGLLKTPTQTRDVELALAALGREFADTVMEKLLVASLEANAAAPRRGAAPPKGEEDAVHGAAYDARVAPGGATDHAAHHLPSSGSLPTSGAAQGKRPSRPRRSDPAPQPIDRKAVTVSRPHRGSADSAAPGEIAPLCRFQLG